MIAFVTNPDDKLRYNQIVKNLCQSLESFLTYSPSPIEYPKPDPAYLLTELVENRDSIVQILESLKTSVDNCKGTPMEMVGIMLLSSIAEKEQQLKYINQQIDSIQKEMENA